MDNKVTTGSCHEAQLYLERLRHIENKYGIIIKEVIADKAYGGANNIQSLHAQDILYLIYLSFPVDQVNVVRLEDFGFSFDQEHNRYICSQGKLLLPQERGKSAVYKSKS